MNIFTKFKNFITDKEEKKHDWKKTGWISMGGEEVNISEVIDYLNKNKVPITHIPVEEIKHLLIHADRDPKRVSNSSFKYPILITKHRGRYYDIIDGNHRLAKAIEMNKKKIKARILDLDTVNVPNKFKTLFIR